MVQDGSSQSQWEAWFTGGGAQLASVPTMMVHGNHEAMATGYFALFSLPGEEEIYSFDYGNTHFVALNDTPRPGEDLTARQAAFLDADLTAARARPVPPRWIITSHHRPMFASDDEGSNLTVRAAWQHLYEKHHVDADFNGHAHQYESTHAIVGEGTLVDAGGIRYITTGGAGALLSGKKATTVNPWTLVYAAEFSFAVVDVTEQSLTIQGRRVDGTAIEGAPIVITHP
jgi:hypothetical protein